MSSYLSLIPEDKNSKSNTKPIISNNQLKYLNKFCISSKTQEKSMKIPSFIKNSHFNQKYTIPNKEFPCQKNYTNPSNPFLPQIIINYAPFNQLSDNNMNDVINTSYEDNSSFFTNTNNTNFTTRKKINQYNFYSSNQKLGRGSIEKESSKNKFFDTVIKKLEYDEQNYYSVVKGKDFVNGLNLDSLKIIQENLKNKLFDMGKGSDFIDFETLPHEIPVNNLNIQKKKTVPSQNISNYNKNDLFNLNSNKENHTISQLNKKSKYYSDKSKNSESFLVNEDDFKSSDKHIFPSYNNIINEDNKEKINMQSSDNSEKNIIKKLKVEKKRSSKSKLSENIEKFRNLEHKKLIYDSLDDEKVKESVIEKTFYISPENIFIISFDSLIFLSSLFVFIKKPTDIILNRCSNSQLKIIVNIFVDILFIIDFASNFFRAYYNFEEQLIIKNDKIIKNYLASYFTIDIISAIPFDSLFHLYTDNYNNCSKNFIAINEQYYKIFSLLKILKFFKCCDKNKNMFIKYCLLYFNKFTFFEKWSFLLGCITVLALLLHTTVCIHIFISTLSYSNWITQQNLQSSSFIKIYISSIYFLKISLKSINNSDSIENSVIEIIFRIFIVIISMVSYLCLISYLSNYIREKNKTKEIFYKKLILLEEIKQEYPEMPKKLYDKISSHLEYINSDQKKNINSLMNSLPNSTQRSLLYEMYKPIINNFYFFKNFHNSEFINRVISKLIPTLAHKNDMLIEQGEILENIIFVKQGKLSIEIKIDADHPEGSIEKLLNEEYLLNIENNNIIQSTSSQLNNNINYKNNIEIQAHPNLNIKYIHLKILDIRKNEHFGALLMFLNQRSPISLRVKTKKAELYILKKIDAVEISSCYPNIWKRVNKKAFHNLKQIKIKMKKIIMHFCDSYGIYKFINFKTNNKKNKLMNKSFEKSKNNNLKLNRSEYDTIFKGYQSKSTKNFLFKAASLPEKRINKDIKMSNILKQHYCPPRKIISYNIPNLKQTLSNNNKIQNDSYKINTSINKGNNIKLSNKIPKIESLEKDSKMIQISNISSIKSIKRVNYLQGNNPFYIRKFGDNFLYSINNSKNNINKNSSILVNSINDLSRTMKIDDNEPRDVLNQIIKNRSFIDMSMPFIQLNSGYVNEEMNNVLKFFGTPYYPEEINDEIYQGENFKVYSVENEEGYNDNEYIQNNTFGKKEQKLFSDPICLSADAYKNNNENSSSLSTIKLKNKLFNINIFNSNKNNFKSNTVNDKNQKNKLCLSHFSLNYDSNLRSSNNNIRNIQENNNKNKVEFSVYKTSLELLSESKENEDINTKTINNKNKNKNDISGFFYMKKSNTVLGKCKSSSDLSSYTENDDVKSYSESINKNKSCDKNSKGEAKIKTNRNNIVKNCDIKNNIEYKSGSIVNSSQSEKTSCFDKLLFNGISDIFASKNNNECSKLKLSKSNFSIKIKSAYKNLNKLSNYEYMKDKNYQKIIKHLIKKKYKKENNIIQNVIKFPTYDKTTDKRNEIKRFQKEKMKKNKKNVNDDIIKLSKNNKDNISKHCSRDFKNKDDEILLANKNLEKDNAVLKNPEKFYTGFFNNLMKKNLLAPNQLNDKKRK